MSVRTVGNLPVEMTSFVGRREDLTHAKNLLASARLLTLTGMGGVGKTRFALRLAGEIRRNFSDGVWLVELADLRQGELLAQTISSVLGLRDESTDPVGFLTEHLRARRLSALFAFITEHEHAEQIALCFVHFTERHDAHLLKAIALYPLGAVRWRKGDVASATALMSEAIRLYQMFEHPGMVAVCIEGLAWSAAASKPDRAALLLGAAKSILQYSQMRLAQAAVQQVTSIVEADLRQKLGNHTFEQIHDKGQELSYDESVALALRSGIDREPQGKESSTRAGLTRREQQIAALVADGLTNREIATKPVISQRTVDAHVEHILTKLGFRSRTQIVRWLDTAERPD
ncbi:hypothetical protein FXW78_15750 [Rhodococcus opacus]|nr:hypothetical protein [Rhodococcus opacus]